MFLKITEKTGKPICVALYALCVYLAAKKKYVPLIVLVLMHLTEYFIIGMKTGKENDISPVKAFFLCLAFGFTWWLPVRSAKKTEE